MPEFETTRCFILAGFVVQLHALATEVRYCITPEYHVVRNFEDEEESRQGEQASRSMQGAGIPEEWEARNHRQDSTTRWIKHQPPP
uniref:Secreted protein n=1 Tax=Oryza punctata TaxID=4537 RepID=A0A0E0LYD5_ORYPU